MSFKFDKSKPEDFGLVLSSQNTCIFIDTKENTEWESKALYDFGWRNENGFIRLPKLNFDALWYLLLNSKLQENVYGAAYIIETEFPDDLKRYLLNILNNQNAKITEPIKKAFKILNLEKVENRNDVLDKSYNEIEKDFETWKQISRALGDILNQ